MHNKSKKPSSLRDLFKEAFVICADEAGFPLSKSGLKDFLNLDLVESESPYHLAGQALEYFCTESGSFNGRMFAVKATILFLTSATGKPIPGAASLKNLNDRLSKNATASDLESWACGAFSQQG